MGDAVGRVGVGGRLKDKERCGGVCGGRGGGGKEG